MAAPEANAPFPDQTAWSMVLRAGDSASPDRDAHLSRLIAIYWRPVYGYLLRRWSLRPEDAADLTQEFFVRLLEDSALKQASPERGRFRTFLKLKLHDLVVDSLRHSGAQKRGGGALHVPIAPGDAAEPAWAGLQPDEAFDREWAACAMEASLRTLENELRPDVFRAFRLCVLERPGKSYRQCAQELGIKESDVRNYVFRARAHLREILLRQVRDSVDDERAAEDELGLLLRLFET